MPDVRPEPQEVLRREKEVPRGKQKPEPPGAAIPDGVHWGVDSFTSLVPLFEKVRAEFNRTPDFWGRYIDPSRSSVMSRDEILFLKQKSPETRLLLIHNPLGKGMYHERVKVGEEVVGFRINADDELQRGRRVAGEAISAAEGLGIKSRVLIYLNIEADSEFPPVGRVSPHFIRGWWEGNGAEFAGIYGNVSNFFPDVERQGKGRVGFIGNAYNAALAGSAFRPFLWGQFPKKGRKFPVPSYQAAQPPNVSKVVRIWQYAPKLKPGGVDLNLCTDEAFAKMLKV